MAACIMSAKQTTPTLSQSQAAALVKKHYKLTTSELHYLPSFEDQNIYIAVVEGGEYVLKIINSEDSKDPILFELQTYAMNFLHENGLPTQTALKTTTGEVMILEDIDCGHGLQKYLVRLLTYLPGSPISKAPISPQLLYEVGQTAARVDNILRQMEHPQLSKLQRDNFKWSLSNVPILEKYLHVLDGDPLKEVVGSVLHQYKTTVAHKYPSFRKCLLHGDLNDLNVLVQANEGKDYTVAGIIDFGDIHFGYYVYELAITIMYMMHLHHNPIDVGGPVLAGWESVLPLNAAERDCLFWLVLSRFCQQLVLCLYISKQHPENEEYLMRLSKSGTGILHKLNNIGKKQVEKVWFQTAAQFNDRK
ncbi:hydroxylysine kinase-like isoform X1 [Phycodurus eques]|uniref:hydroxylysine kinase-like isoform X1 n=1 Tax=Phycodurus eques TaxID=693459 RepID=UPI002ACF0119|nr:hydroxylysine kinase-like isoform X1 [Phycodurus eques]